MRVVLGLLMAAAITAAHATDFGAAITDMAGTPVADELSPGKPEKSCGSDAEAKACLTLGRAVYHALVNSYSDEGTVTGEEKYRRAALALRLREAKEEKVGVEDLALIKKLIAKLYGPLVVYRTWSLLDPSMVK